MVAAAPALSGRDTSDNFASGVPLSRSDTGSKPRVHLNARRLQLRNPGLFLDGDERARRLIERAFVLDEVRSVVVRRDLGKIAIELTSSADTAAVWLRLGTLLRGAGAVADIPHHARNLALEGVEPGLPVRITRVGDVLTTFRARILTGDHLLIGHPLLRQRKWRQRFEDFVRSIHGVTAVRSIRLRASVLVVYDPALIEVRQILRLVESVWADLASEPLPGPPPRKLFVATGLLAFSFTAQFLRPVLLPWATAAAAIYALPNLFAAVRDLARGRIGLPALYTAGLGFLLWNRLPFATSVISTLTQLWPSLANALAAQAERRLFAEHRRRLAWTRLVDAGHGEITVTPADLAPGATILVRTGEFLAADGVVIRGNAAVDENVLSGARGVVDKTVGDTVYAGAFVRDGVLALRVERVGGATTAATLARALPHGVLKGLPSGIEVERIANRNAKPALAAAALLLLATRTPRLSQIAIRPDYATAPRLSAHLSALAAIAESLGQGALIRRPAAIDQLPLVDVFIFDDGLGFDKRRVEIAKVNAAIHAGGLEAIAFAATALAGYDDERAQALYQELEDSSLQPTSTGRREYAGAVSFRDNTGALVVVASPARAIAEHFAAPSNKISALVGHLAAQSTADAALRPLVVARDRRILGVIQFARQGALRTAETVAALRVQHPQARFVHVSAAPQEDAEALSAEIGFDAVFGGLDPHAKALTVRSLSERAAWIGNGADRTFAAIGAASLVSISLSGLPSLPDDHADIILLRDDLRALLAPSLAADRHSDRRKADYRTVYLANLLAVAGAAFPGFGSLQAGLTSNAGSAAVFLSRWSALNALVSRTARIAETRRATVPFLASPQRRGIPLPAPRSVP